jgi:hypothetical protein
MKVFLVLKSLEVQHARKRDAYTYVRVAARLASSTYHFMGLCRRLPRTIHVGSVCGGW